MTNKDIVRRLILREVEMMQPMVQGSFEENPIEFLLNKYPSMKQALEMLMTSAFKDYISGIYIVAPKPTTFKIVLHNDQDFYLTYMGKAYEANVSGKKFYLQTIGEKERCMEAIARLLMLGNPIQTKGPDEGEAAAEAEAEGGEGEFGGGGGGIEAAPSPEDTGTEEAEETES
jgi:hypothetical protein